MPWPGPICHTTHTFQAPDFCLFLFFPFSFLEYSFRAVSLFPIPIGEGGVAQEVSKRTEAHTGIMQQCLFPQK